MPWRLRADLHYDRGPGWWGKLLPDFTRISQEELQMGRRHIDDYMYEKL
jgi:hypothetical protein